MEQKNFLYGVEMKQVNAVYSIGTIIQCYQFMKWVDEVA